MHASLNRNISLRKYFKIEELGEDRVLTTAMIIIQYKIFHKIKKLLLSSPDTLDEVISLLTTPFINMDHLHRLKDLTLKNNILRK